MTVFDETGESRGVVSNIDVTVVVPCYNTEKFLDQALSSIEQNDRCSLEVIVVNDGSTDGSLAIMRSHEATDDRVRVIDKPNGGYGSAVNRGFSEARGTYLAILEPDDWAEPHMYDDLIDYARTFSLTLGDDAPDIVKSPYWRIWMPTTPQERAISAPTRVVLPLVCPSPSRFRRSPGSSSIIPPSGVPCTVGHSSRVGASA